jgi:hypothetical protein
MAAASVTASAPGNLTISPPSNPSAGSYFEVPVSGTSDASGLSLVTLYATAPGQACAASSAALSDYEFDPQGTALVTGPGSFSNAVGIDVATPGIYQLCGYVGTFGVEASATVTVVSLACGEAPDLSVTAPATVLAGRRGAVVISPGSSNVLGTDSNVSVGTAPANPAEPIHFPSSGQTPEAAVGVDDEYDGGFQTHIGDGPIMVTIQWTQMAADGSTCTRIAASMPVTVVNSGQQAALRMRTSLVNAQATLAFTGDCELIGPSPATVTLKGAGLVRRFRLPDVCGRWSRTGGPGLPNLSVGTQSASVTTPASLDLFTAGGQTASHSYTLMARYAGATHTFQLVASVTHQPLTLVYEGTDAFVNYCIDDAKRIMSLNHQLYCVRPGFTLRGLTVTK